MQASLKSKQENKAPVAVEMTSTKVKDGDPSHANGAVKGDASKADGDEPHANSPTATKELPKHRREAL